jgi:aminopeptidase N
MIKKISACILLGSALTGACRSAKHRNSLSGSMDTITVSAFNNPMNLYRASAPRDWFILHTRAALSFDYRAKTATGHATLTLQPYFYATDSLTLDAKGMDIKSVQLEPGNKPLPFTYDSSRLQIQLDKSYTRHEQLKLSIRYVAQPYAARSVGGGSAAIKDDKGLYFINTDSAVAGKPVQVWTQGETESNSNWLPTIDKPNMRTTVELELTVPSKYKTLSNGALVATKVQGDTRTDTWKTEQAIQVYAIMFAIGDFSITKDRWKDKEVNYYVEQAFAPYAKTMFQNTPEMIGFFSDVTGVPYPWNKYSQVVVRDYVSGAMENTSASLFGEFMNQDEREYADENHEDVVSHELFHQWFGDYVTAESWSNLTVNESFATYGEYLWRKHKYGVSYADELAWSDLQKYLDYSDYSDPVLVRHYYRDKEDMFDRVSYQKGGAILHYLHHLAGDSAFYKAMNLYLTRNALQPAEAAHWRLAVEEATGKDWNWFFNQWYLRAGHPVLDVQYQDDPAAKKLTVTVTQVQKEGTGLYALPLKTLLIYGTEQQSVGWTIRKQKEVFVYEYKNGLAPVLVPDVVHVLPGKIIDHKEYSQWLAQLTHCTDFVSRLQAVESVQTKDVNNTDARAILAKGLEDRSAPVRQAALKTIGSITNDDLRAKWIPDIVNVATQDGNNKTRAAAFEILGRWKVKEQTALIRDAVSSPSYFVAGNALSALKELDDSLAYSMARHHLAGRSNTNLDRKAWTIVSARAADEDTTLLRANASGDRWHMVNNFALFAGNARSEHAFALATDLLTAKIRATDDPKQRKPYVAFLAKLYKDLEKKKNTKDNLYAYKSAYLKQAVRGLNVSETDEGLKAVYDALLSNGKLRFRNMEE